LSDVHQRFRLIVPVLVILVVVSGYLVYSLVLAMPYEPLETELPDYTLQGDYQHRAIVTSANPLWVEGTLLEDRPIYFSSATPVVEIDVTFQTLADSVDLDTVMTSWITLSAKDSETVLWEKQKPVSQKEGQIQGELLTDTLLLNVMDLGNEIAYIQNGLGTEKGSGSIELNTVVAYTGSVNENPVAGEMVYSMPLEVGQGYFMMPVNFSIEEVVTKSESTMVRSESPTFLQYASVLSFSLAVGLLLGTCLVRFRFSPVDDRLLKLMQVKDQHAKYEEWISAGTLPDNVPSGRIQISSLDDLIKAAVDMNERVIYDEEKGIYFFIHNNIAYTFSLDDPES
jgi:hypothetical protein